MSEPKEPLYLTVDEVTEINRRTVERHGGSFGIRDQGLLESAVAQPEGHVFGADLHPTMAENAAAYMYHLSQNHPFQDGNKRTALTVTSTFLKMNDHQLTMTNEQAERVTLELASGELSKKALTQTLAQHIEPSRELAEQRRRQVENAFGDPGLSKQEMSEEKRRELQARAFGDAAPANRNAAAREHGFERSR